MSLLDDALKDYDKRRNGITTDNTKKTVLGTVSGGTQLFGQGILKGAEGLFIDLPTQIAAGTLRLVGQKDAAEGMSEFARWDLTNAAINKAGGYETNPYLNQNVNLYNKNVLNKSSYITDENFGGKLVQGIGEMIPTIAIGGAAGKAAANVALGGKSFASGYNEAFGESGDVGKSTLYGLLTAGTELATEQISGGIPGLKKIEGATGKEVVKNYIKDVIGEGAEEVIAELVNPLTQTVYKGSDSLSQYGTKDFWGGVLESGLLGAAIGGTLDSPNLRGIRAATKASKSSSINQNAKGDKPTSIQSDIDINKGKLPTKTAIDVNTRKANANVETQQIKATQPATQVTTNTTATAQETVNGKTYNEYDYSKDKMPQEVTAKFDAKSNDGVNLYSTMGEQKRSDDLMRKLVNNMQETVTRTNEPLLLHRGAKADEIFSDSIVRSSTMSKEVAEKGYAAREKNGTVYDIYVDTNTPVTFTTQTADPRYKTKGEYWNRSREVILYPELYNIKQKGNKVYLSPKTDTEIDAILKENAKNKDISTDDARELMGRNRQDGKKTLNKQEVEKKETKKQEVEKKETKKKETRTEKIEGIKKEVKETTKKELSTTKETSKVTPTELTESFSKIEEAYKNANKYTGEIKAEFLKETQKEYNKYRANGGDKTIAALEEGYQAKKQLEKAALNKDTDDMFNPGQANVKKMQMEIKTKQVEKSIASKSTKALKEAEVAKVLEEYNTNVAKGMDTIEYYENLKKQYNIHQEVSNNVVEKKPDLTKIPVVEETAKEIKVENDAAITGNAVMDEAIGLDEELMFANDANEYMDMFDEEDFDDEDLKGEIIGDALVIKSKNSAFNKEYNEQQNKLNKNAKVTMEEYTELEDTRNALNKKKQVIESKEKEGLTAIKQRLLDMYASLRKIDKANGNNNIINALSRRNHKNNIAAQSFFGSNMIDYKGNWMNTLSGSKAVEAYTNLPDNLRTTADYYLRLQQDTIDKINHRDYSSQFSEEYVNNIFPDNSIEDNIELINDIETEYPELVSVIKNDLIPKLSEYNYAMNKQLISSGVMNEYTIITKDVAKEIMEMTDEEIKEATVGKFIKVNTADYFYNLNPWYSPITREVVKTGTGMSNSTDIPVGKLKGRVEGAERYNIQPLDQSLAERTFSNYAKMIENDFRRTVAESYMKQIDTTPTETDIDNIETTDDVENGSNETKGLNFVDGQYTMAYLGTGKNGQLVNKTLKISRNMYDAMNGIDEWARAFRQSKLGKVMAKKASIQKAMLTKLNLPWQGSNFIRDFGDAIINSEFTGRETMRFMKNEFGAFIIDAKNNTPEYQTFMANRGETLTQTDKKGFIQKKTPLENAINKMNNALEVSELTTRYALYKTALQSGYSIEEAMRISNEGTTDFSKTGSLWKSLDSAGLTVFLGSSVAGVNRFIDSTITPYTNLAKEAINKAKYGTPINSKTAKRAVTQAVKTALIFGLGRELLKKLYDDEESQKAIANLSDTEIRDNIIIPVGDGVIKIPKGRIWRAYDAIEDIMSGTTIRDEDKLPLVDTVNYVWDSVGVNGLDSSTSFSNFMSIMKNEDYYGNAIYSDGKVVSKETFDYLLKQYGTIYYNTFRYVNGATDINPWVSKFYTDTNTVSSYNSRYYNMKDAYENLKPNSDGSFNSTEDAENYFAWKVLNYERSYGELGTELKVLKSLKADYASSTDDIREQEDKIKRIYSDIYSYIDNNKYTSYTDANGKNVIKIGDEYTYTLNDNGDGTFSYKKKSTKK
jgi:hypothetical protein